MAAVSLIGCQKLLFFNCRVSYMRSGSRLHLKISSLYFYTRMYLMRNEVVMVVNMEIMFLWDVTPCSLICKSSPPFCRKPLHSSFLSLAFPSTCGRAVRGRIMWLWLYSSCRATPRRDWDTLVVFSITVVPPDVDLIVVLAWEREGTFHCVVSWDNLRWQKH